MSLWTQRRRSSQTEKMNWIHAQITGPVRETPNHYRSASDAPSQAIVDRHLLVEDLYRGAQARLDLSLPQSRASAHQNDAVHHMHPSEEEEGAVGHTDHVESDSPHRVEEGEEGRMADTGCLHRKAA